jgi:hypothetical protein
MFGFTRCQKRFLGNLKNEQAKWMFENGAPLSSTYQKLCNYTHARPDAGYRVLWESNGPVYNNEAIKLTFFSRLAVYALCYLLVRLARPRFTMPKRERNPFRARLGAEPWAACASVCEAVWQATALRRQRVAAA